MSDFINWRQDDNGYDVTCPYRTRRVAFDIGNVLVHVDLDGFLEFLVQEGIVSDFNRANEFLLGLQAGQDLGLYNIRQGFYRFSSSISKKQLEMIHDKWIDIVTPSEVMLDLVDELIHKHRFHVALLSNIGFDHAKYLRSKCKIFEDCTQHFSCEVGARKPTKLYYQSFVKEEEWNKPRYYKGLFFDDRSENVQAAYGHLDAHHFNLDDYESDERAAGALASKIKDIFS